jgi:PRTRC genetic system protein E
MSKGGAVFVELMPVLAGRTVMITIARIDEERIRVNVIPTKASQDENTALSTPLSFTGSPAELDAELGKQLGAYAGSHRQLRTTLAEAKAQMDAAAKAAQKKARRQTEERGREKSTVEEKTSVPTAELESPGRRGHPLRARPSRRRPTGFGSISILDSVGWGIFREEKTKAGPVSR